MADLDVFALPVFPAADVFPMMAEDELADLAEDIKAHGLLESLVVANIDNELLLVDGRNRRAACKIAGIDPVVRQMDGEDPTAYVLSANIHRRHMTKGQRAMAVAKIYPEAKGAGRGKKSLIIKEFGSSYISRARTILRHAPDLADNVLNGSASLDTAYQTACERKDAASSDESRLADLRSRFPELADKMVRIQLAQPGPARRARFLQFR